MLAFDGNIELRGVADLAHRQAWWFGSLHGLLGGRLSLFVFLQHLILDAFSDLYGFELKYVRLEFGINKPLWFVA